MDTESKTTQSPFLSYYPNTRSNDLIVLHLKRDSQVPILLNTEDSDDEGYEEGRVINTRFGSFPQSTLLGLPWGSQILASTVDTGSRSSRRGGARKRKRDEISINAPAKDLESVKTATVAESGFSHLLPPTPENWTTSLPHRTQVVYSHDSSYILQRLRARPGSIIIEAGAGSGSFTHAAARAVHGPGGRVLSFEFHKQRFETLQKELRDHRLEEVVELRHADVCESGFDTGESKANAVFLDLPAPWLALKHLTRKGPLSAESAIRLCTFSPCIEQVQRTINEMQDLGWLDIETVEVAAKRIEVRRTRVGLQEEGLRGVNASAASVDEAICRLRDIERRNQQSDADDLLTKEQRLKIIKTAQSGRKLHMEGKITHRSEYELKTHTSYLVFAILPMEWTEEDEARAQASTIESHRKGKSKKQMKREHKMSQATKESETIGDSHDNT